MINKGVELNEAGVDCQLMMETSGHGALKENRWAAHRQFATAGGC